MAATLCIQPGRNKKGGLAAAPYAFCQVLSQSDEDLRAAALDPDRADAPLGLGERLL